MPNHRGPPSLGALAGALILLSMCQQPRLAQAQTLHRPFVELGLAVGAGRHNFGWRAHLAIEEPSDKPLGRRWEVAGGQFGAGHGCPLDASFHCGRGVTWVVSGAMLWSYQMNHAATGGFFLFGPGLSYSRGSVHRAAGVLPMLQVGGGVASKAVGGPVFVIQARIVAHGIWKNRVGEVTLGLGARL